MIRALFKFDKNIPKGAYVIDTTSNSGDYRLLSPFVLPAPPAKNFENLWQFSKVYKEHLTTDGEITNEWLKWNLIGCLDEKAHRYPMGKGRKPEFSFWHGKRLDYIEARKQIYAREYAKNVRLTPSFTDLSTMYKVCRMTDRELVLLDYDAYDHQALGMTLKDVINNPNRKMGHAFVLIMMLTGVLEECLGRLSRE